jgi:uncharacterized protein
MSSKPSQFVWYELMTTDVAAAEAFYAKAVGWKTCDSGMPGMKYTLLSAGDYTVGGVMALDADAIAGGARPGWGGYVGVADVDAAAVQLKAGGGQVMHGPADIPGVGRFAAVTDPHGAAFYLFKGNAGEMPAAPAAGTPGTVGWHELHAGDGAAALAFYAAQFGWTKDTAVDMGPMGVYQLFAAGGEAIGGMMTKTADMPAPCWLYYFNVDRADAAVDRVTGAGGKVLMGPHEVPGGSWIVQCQDPQGAMFAVVAPQR